MSRLTLTQQRGLNRYRDAQRDATRSAGQAAADARHWGERSAFMCRAIERDWSQRGIAGHTSQMEMSPNATAERGVRRLKAIAAVVCVVLGTACTAWLAGWL